MRFIILLVFFSACSSPKEYRLVAVENIQFMFERFVEDKNVISEKQFFASMLKKNNLFSEFRGNVLLIHDLHKTKAFVEQYEQQILLDKNLKFYWDTLSTPQKLYCIDLTKGVSFVPEKTTNDCVEKCTLNLQMSLISNEQINAYRAKQIGKEFVLIRGDEFVSGASNMIQKENNLIIKEGFLK